MHQLNLFRLVEKSNEVVMTEERSFTAEREESINVNKNTPEENLQENQTQDFTTDTSSFEENDIEETAKEVRSISTLEKLNNIQGKGRGRKSYKEMDAEVHLVTIPEDEELFKKQYYSISEVAQWFCVNTSLIRFWENEFDILKPRKNKKGDRLFRPQDVKNLELIYHLLRQRKYSIEGARQYLKENKKKAEQNMQLLQSLTKFRSFLLELKATIN